MYNWNKSTGATFYRYNGYFRVDPLANFIANITAGTTYTYTFNITQVLAEPTYINGKPTVPNPIVSIPNATGVAEIWIYGQSPRPIMSIPISHVSGNTYKVTINTVSLTPGQTYVLFINATYIEPLMLNYSANSVGGGIKYVDVPHFYTAYYTFNVLPTTTVSTTTTTTTTTSTTTTTTSIVTTVTPVSSVSAPPAPPSVSVITISTSPVVYGSLGVGIILVIAAIVVAVLLGRRS